MADYTSIYYRTSLTGGGDTALDNLDGSTLQHDDSALVVTSSYAYFYKLDATSGAPENSPNIIAPDSNPGTKRWVLISIYGSGEINTASNIGSGEGLFAQKSGNDLQFKSLVAGDNITLTSTSGSVTISGGGSGNSNEISQGNSYVKVEDTGTGLVSINVDGDTVATFNNFNNLNNIVIGKPTYANIEINNSDNPQWIKIFGGDHNFLKIEETTGGGGGGSLYYTEGGAQIIAATDQYIKIGNYATYLKTDYAGDYIQGYVNGTRLLNILSSTQTFGYSYHNSIEINQNFNKIEFTANNTLMGTINSSGLRLYYGAYVTNFSTNGTLSGNSDDTVPTEKAVKTYVDTEIAGISAGSTTLSGLTDTPSGYDNGKFLKSTTSGTVWATVSGGTGTSNHSELNELDYDSSGHTGFASSAQLTTTSGDIISQIVTDHGDLTGLDNDDHPQYLNNARGDARYYRMNFENVVISAADILSKSTTISIAPKSPQSLQIFVYKGNKGFYGYDYTISGTTVSWNGLNWENILSENDMLEVTCWY